MLDCVATGVWVGYHRGATDYGNSTARLGR